MIVEVVINSSARQIDKKFDYLVPQRLINQIEIGQRVFVPFGNQKIIGYVTKLKETSDSCFKLKEIIEIIDPIPLLTNSNIDLARKISKYYFSSFGKTLELFIPNALRTSINKKLIFKNKNYLSEGFKKVVGDNDTIMYSASLEPFTKEISKLVSTKNIEVEYILKDKSSIKTVTYLKFKSDYTGRSKDAQNLSAYLKEINKEISKKSALEFSSNSAIETLVKNNCIELSKHEEYRKVDVLDLKEDKVVLNSKQKEICDSIKTNLNKFDTYLIHGVCGSGKTEIYLNLIEEVLKQNKSALMLVPEISLTPQMSSRFVNRFGNFVAIIHSGLNDNLRYDEYRRIKNNEARVIVGVRSAIFSPIQNLGIIIMDEEQEESYIQDHEPNYDSHFVCEALAREYNIPYILGSATPSIKSYYYALTGKYKLFSLYQRANNKVQEKSIVINLVDELRHGNRTPFSEILKKEIIKNYDNNLQTILFINKRGFSSFVCRSCGQAVKCPNCDVSLTFHKETNKLKCHYCNYSILATKECPSCKSSAIRDMSIGTERICEEVNKILPEARILRVDQDTMTNKSSYNEMTEKIKNHEVDIIVGTQIVAKGLDFPLVSLVGVINADIGLNMPFYNAYEKTYDLLEQVTGRAGRKDTEGVSIIQSYNIDASPIKYAQNHSYLAFYNEEIKRRELSNNPPFTTLIELLVKSCEQMAAYEEIKKIRDRLKNHLHNSLILGPSTDRVFKLNNEYRYIITIKAKENENFDYLNELYDDYKNISKLDVFIKRM